jgi:hypothetical protein
MTRAIAALLLCLVCADLGKGWVLCPIFTAYVGGDGCEVGCFEF